MKKTKRNLSESPEITMLRDNLKDAEIAKLKSNLKEIGMITGRLLKTLAIGFVVMFVMTAYVFYQAGARL